MLLTYCHHPRIPKHFLRFDGMRVLLASASGAAVNTYGYTDLNHPHAVRQHQSVNQFSYDANGNLHLFPLSRLC